MHIKENISLLPYSHYRIGGPSRFFVIAKTPNEVRNAIIFAKKRKMPIFVLGGGTNLLIGENGYKGLVLKPDIKILHARLRGQAKGETVTVGAGVLIADFLTFTAKKGLSGLEWAGGLPGTVGGAIRGNAGCFGGETKDTIFSVQSFDAKTMQFRERNNKECRFGYRASVFKNGKGQEIILSATFKLKRGNKTEIEKAIVEKIAYRKERHPLEYPNIGSIFKNVDLKKMPKKFHKKVLVKNDPYPVVPAAHLIGRTGLKGVSYGGAMISGKHANFIVNALDASAKDVKALMSLIKKEVKKKFGVKLFEEIELV